MHSELVDAKVGTVSRDQKMLYCERLETMVAGDYGDPVMEARKLDRLTDTGGHRVKELDQVSR